MLNLMEYIKELDDILLKFKQDEEYITKRLKTNTEDETNEDRKDK